ncbi:MAG: SH3 domain-containing protein [Devosia sp.]|nr:SH3 domain-containing protein [Devosia sp.]
MKPLLLPAALALATLTAAPALASEARASGNAPVRSGPGSFYRVVDRLVDGEYYEVERCTRQALWCLVSEEGDLLGWVRGSQLVGSPAKVNVTPFEFLVTPDLLKAP